MKLIIGTANIKPGNDYPVVAIGNFDGLHVGHRVILEETIKRAKENNGTSVVLTFEPHPIRAIRPDSGLRLMNPFQIKMRLIENTGIDVGYVATFNKAFAEHSPEEFAKAFLHEKIGCREVIVGEDFRFGKDRAGNVEDLIRYGKKFGFEVLLQKPVLVENEIVSSSTIRRLIYEGNVRLAGKMLGHYYVIEGKVVAGDGEGKKHNTPTANIPFPNEVAPQDGIYAVRVEFLKGQNYGTKDGVAYIGSKPSFKDKSPRIEIHLFDFDDDLYEKRLRVVFVDFIRADKKFEKMDDLLHQIDLDIKESKSILAENPEGPRVNL